MLFLFGGTVIPTELTEFIVWLKLPRKERSCDDVFSVAVATVEADKRFASEMTFPSFCTLKPNEFTELNDWGEPVELSEVSPLPGSDDGVSETDSITVAGNEFVRVTAAGNGHPEVTVAGIGLPEVTVAGNKLFEVAIGGIFIAPEMNRPSVRL